MAKRRAGDREARATRRSLGLRARAVAAVGDAAQPRPARCSAIFSDSPDSPRSGAGFAFPFRPLTEIRAGRGGRARGGGGPRAGRPDGRGKGGRRAGPGGVWGVRRVCGGRGGRAGGGGMRARGTTRRLLRPDGKSRAQSERSIKMAAASAVAAASGR